MPNYVHAIVRPLGHYTLSEILHTWKSFTANRANRLLDRSGKFWQPESYDHLIRGEQDLRNRVRYVLENPQKAGLKSWPWVASSIGFQPMSNRQDADATTVSAPGQLSSHYAPKTPLRLVDNGESVGRVENRRVGLLTWNGWIPAERCEAVRVRRARQDVAEAGADL